MNITLRTWLYSKLAETERMQSYEVATETVRIWIDEYDSLSKSETPLPSAPNEENTQP